MPRVYIALGGNLGDRHANLIAAIDRLRVYTRLLDLSAVYETEPWGVADQPRFLNAACAVETDLAPGELLACLKSIETELGREPSIRYGPRKIDLDLLLYSDVVVDQPDLSVPHPRLAERAFVLVPLSEIAPDAVHPVLRLPMRDLAARVDGAGVVKWAKRPTFAGDFMFHWGYRTYLMGVVNVTPDSFSGDGILTAGREAVVERAVAQARRMLAGGAHLIDVGGESTRPGAAAVDAAEELRRVLPVVEALAHAGLGPISIDTYKSEVARAALDAGAAIVNDVWGLRRDERLAALVAGRGAPVVVMHNRSKPQDAAFEARLGPRYVGSTYDNLIEDVKRELAESVVIGLRAGIDRHRIVIDPGIGFGKTVEHNLELLDRLDALKSLDLPILIGPSRKSFIGYTLDAPPDQRGEGTAAAVAIAITRGADIVRVHDLPEMARVARMADAIVRRSSERRVQLATR
ncbi:MAG TPA: dihydropteroate synthase [Anaerolineae bacterium]|nr:dihydropteroate synthase [Anaerolineae bacterium]